MEARSGKPVRGVIPPADDNETAMLLASSSDWTTMGEAEHFAQFYETDEFLLNSLGDFVGTALGAGDAGIVVATKVHREALEQRLQAYGVDLAAARASGQYMSLDAEETLLKFLVDRSPEPTRFEETIGGIVSRASNGGRRVRIFGEMVALLWAEGNYDAAIRLEQLWNELKKTQPFMLFCGYPMHSLSGQALAQPLSDTCAEHSRIIPAESYTALTDTGDRLRVILELQQKARSLEAEIAERKQVEETLRGVKDELERMLTSEQIARSEAEAANRMKDEFLATVSHELRTPLSAIMGWSHVLRSGRVDQATAARAVETIERNARIQAQLIEDILDVSRVITGKLRLNITQVDVASVINAAIDSVQLAAESKGIQLEVRLDPSARHVSGDSGRLQQIVWNLLSNAIKFTPSGGRVEVRLEHVDSDIQIRVSDTGQGISPDFLPFIFDRFRQADGTSTRRHGGLGLGLAIVRHLVELHGGSVFADSPGEGQGATFTIRFPQLGANERVGARKKIDTGSLRPFESVPSVAGLRVLLVDDDQDNLELVTVMLKDHDANVQAVGSVAEALEVLNWFEPEVLISDLAMPGEDGYSLITKVRAFEAQTGRHIAAIALTAYVRVEDRTRALTAGYNMFVPKPAEPKELISAVANIAEAAAREFTRARSD
ncbi:MAG: ATP-binding protein [Blastocatellia bacterium]